jgi:hypothetical protein
VILSVYITKVAKASLEKALAENNEIEGILTPSMPPVIAESPLDLHRPLIIKIEPLREDNEKKNAHLIM